MQRKSFVFSQEGSAALERLRIFARLKTTAQVIHLALVVLWDCVHHLMTGGKIVITDAKGNQRLYDPTIDPESMPKP